MTDSRQAAVETQGIGSGPLRRAAAVAEIALVAMTWASSFVLVKLALADFGPLTIAGLRYFLSFLVLLPFLLARERVALDGGAWLRLGVLGLSVYLVGNGAMFWALQWLPATTVSLLQSLLPLVVLGVGWVWLKEAPSRVQAAGILVSVGGGVLYLSAQLQPGEPLGLLVAGLGLMGFIYFAVAGRAVARTRVVGVLALTAVPLGIGGGATLGLALLVEGVPQAPPAGWGIILILTLVNTTFAYLLYNHALHELKAFEANTVLSLIPLGTALFSWALLGETLGALQTTGLAVALAGAALAQWRGATPLSKNS